MSVRADREEMWDVATMGYEPRELYPGTFALMTERLGTNAGFVVGDSAVFAIDSAINKVVTEKILLAIRERTPKPIKYLVNLTTHGDHCFGNRFFPQETLIVSHRDVKRRMVEKWEEEKAFMIGLLGEGMGIEEAEHRLPELTFDEGLEVELGGIRVELRCFGFCQHAGDTVAYIPEGKIAFTGNIVVGKPIFPWLLEGHSEDYLRVMRRLKEELELETIVPGHGPLCTPSDIDRHIEYLEDLRAAVGRAIEKGLSLEEAPAACELPRFRDYNLYEKIHLGLNVPNVYREMKG